MRDVSNHDDRNVVRNVKALEKIINVCLLDSSHRGLAAAYVMAVRMIAVDGFEEGFVGLFGRGRLDGFDFLQSLLMRAFEGDRKSTRLNSSHLGISYAVFCLKKKIYMHDALDARPEKGTNVIGTRTFNVGLAPT